MMIGLQSDANTWSEVELSDYMARNIIDDIRRIDGVGRVQSFGAEDDAFDIPDVVEGEQNWIRGVVEYERWLAHRMAEDLEITWRDDRGGDDRIPARLGLTSVPPDPAHLDLEAVNLGHRGPARHPDLPMGITGPIVQSVNLGDSVESSLGDHDLCPTTPYALFGRLKNKDCRAVKFTCFCKMFGRTK